MVVVSLPKTFISPVNTRQRTLGQGAQDAAGATRLRNRLAHASDVWLAGWSAALLAGVTPVLSYTDKQGH